MQLPARAALLLGAVAVIASPSRAQRAESSAFHVVAFTTGGTTMSVDALNPQLSAANFAGLSNDGISYGLTAHYAFGRALLGVDGALTTFGEEGLSNGRTDDLNSTIFLGTAAYAIYASPHFQLYPQLGVGLGHFDITLRDRNGGARAPESEPTFAELAASPGSSATIEGRHLLFSAGVGGDMLVTRGGGDGFGVVFGVRAGVMVAPNRTTWSSNGSAVDAGPDASAQGPYLRVVIGLGGR